MNKLFSWFSSLFIPRNTEEFLEFMRTAERKKIIDSDSERMIEGVLQVSQLQVRDIMIPRPDIISINKNQTITEIVSIISESLHSRYPVFGTEPQDVYGILLAKEVLQYALPENQARFDLRKIAQPAMIVPETQLLNKLLNDFKKRRTHMAMVIDEYGSIVGLVTLEDVLEQIVGEIEDETDYDEENAIKHHKDYWIVKASTSLDDFNQYFASQLADASCESIGGLVINTFGYIPKRHETITLGNLQFKIINSDQRKIQLLQVLKV